MKTSKKLLSVVMVMIMCFSVVSMTDLAVEANASSEYYGCIGGVEYSNLGRLDYAVATGLCSGKSCLNGGEHEIITNITIPSTVTLKTLVNNTYTYKTFEVKEVNNYWRSYHEVDKVVINEGVEVIGASSFSGCYNLTDIAIPKTVKTIGDNAFYNCINLSNINFGASDTPLTIGERAFYGNVNIKNLDLSRVKTIGVAAFENATIENINFGSEVDSIGFGAFNGSTIGNIVLPEKVNTVYVNFAGAKIDTMVLNEGFSADISNYNLVLCETIKNFSVNEKNKYYSSVDGVLFNKNQTELICYPSEKSEKRYEMPDSVEIISTYAFVMCNNLEYIKLSQKLKNIKINAFFDCKNLKEISKIPNTVENIENQAFINHALTDVYFDGTETEWKSVEVINSSLNVGAFYPAVTMHFNDEIPPIIDPPAPEPDEPDEPDVPDIPTDHEHDYDDDKDETCNTCGYDRTENCDCRCHNDNFFAKILWKIINFFNKIFKKNAICACGIAHY